MSDYKTTLNLPKTDFPMKADLIRREPETLRFWEEIAARREMLAASGSNGSYVLHDGPPYANGHIHLGTALNKILKDIIVKSRNMNGYACDYVPGWDCHGLPIEHKVELDLKDKREMLEPLKVRELCRAYANKWINIQREEFKRLGVFADWENPYLSMQPAYEAAIASNLAGFVAGGYVTRDRKPIYWCCDCHTALAEAEVEYADETSPSIYVSFPITDKKLKEIFPAALDLPAYVIIWTTTPWTIPDNVAISVHPEAKYVLVAVGKNQYLLAKDRLESCAKIFNWTTPNIIGEVEGALLEGLETRHPIYDRKSPLILGTHVTMDAGAGCVHTAPGHGREDYEVGVKYNLEILSPLNEKGRFLPSVEYFAGMSVTEANSAVIAKLRENNLLLAAESLSHSYPHCWRCKNPVIFRATTQWFIKMEANDLRSRTLKAIDGEINWIPSWGRDRIYNMIETRPDWCISRQRQWGVPIVALKCKECGQIWNDPAWMREICARFATFPTGCDYWYTVSTNEIVPPDLACPSCGKKAWEKETDILDVWFDSGTSFSAVLEARPNLRFPADLYLEGSDQHRGWFHSSLLIAEALRYAPPYKSVLTHGYVVDGEGRKMSKSLGNVTAPEEIINKYGADILRLWAASVDYKEDIRISDEILRRLVDAYRRIRNTCRFILGNLNDFTREDFVPLEEMLSLDKYALDKTRVLEEECVRAYLQFDFHKVFHTLHNFCVTTLSAQYLDILKDRLYADLKKGQKRKSAQTSLWHILQSLLRIMAPILSFTAEEVFRTLPKNLKGPENTVFAMQNREKQGARILSPEMTANWDLFFTIKEIIGRVSEPLRKEGAIGHSLDTKVVAYASEDIRKKLEALEDLTSASLTSQFSLDDIASAPNDAVRNPEIPDIALMVSKAEGQKCARCWKYSTDVGSNTDHIDVCVRCAEVLKTL